MPRRKQKAAQTHAPKNPYGENPKDAVSGNKLPTHFVPDIALVELSLAMLEGALKYGKVNFRAKKVRASVYLDALDRHRMKFAGGTNIDPKTMVHHMGYVMACAAILIDAQVRGTMIDDRPYQGPNPIDMEAYIDQCSERVENLREMFKDHKPHHYVINDPVVRRGKRAKS